MKRAMICFMVIAALCLIFVVSRVTAQQRQQMGGRPGEFHFILKDQADHNRAEFRNMQTRITRMKADVMASAADEGTRARMLQNLDQFSLFVSSMEAQLTVPAGQTAGDVEQRLNFAKGEAACVMCHENMAPRGR